MRLPVGRPASTVAHALSLPVRGLVVAATLSAGIAWLGCKGPVPVLRGSQALDVDAPLWYLASAFVALGILVADGIELVRSASRRFDAAILGAEIVILIALGSMRLGSAVPVSGHAALFTLLLIRTLVERMSPDRTVRKIELATAAGLLLMTAYVKLAWWDDPLTLTLGCGAGAAVAGVGALAMSLRRTVPPT